MKLKIIGILAILLLPVFFYFHFVMKGDTVNKLEREVFIARGSEEFNVYILNSGTQIRSYHAVTKVTSEAEKGYYYFWAETNGHKFYVQSPIINTVIEER